MSVVSNNILAGASGQGAAGYEIERSLRFNSADSADLRRVFAAGGSKTKFTISSWVKFSESGGYQWLLGVNSTFGINRTSTDKLRATLYSETSGQWAVIADSQAVLRDYSAWYHIVVTLDTSAGSSNADRIKLWINGVQQTFDFTVYQGGLISGNIRSFNDNTSHSIGSRNGSYYSNFYLADYHFVDGQALAPTDFGEFDTDNVWQPKKYTGSYGPVINQTQTWSSSTGYVDSDGTQSSANIFDGNLSTYVSGRPSSTVVTLANSITAQSKIRFYGAWEDIANSRWAVNGTATNAVPLVYTNNTTFGWSEPTNLTFPLTITTVGVLGGSSGAGGRFVAVEVDGKLLVDYGISAVDNGFYLDFSDNSSNAALGTDTSGNNNTWTVNNLSAGGSNWNQSQTWSNGLSALSGSLTNPTNGFDGNTGSYADSTAGFSLDLSGHTFGTGSHSIEVKSGGATSFSVNGSTSLNDPGGGGAKVWTGTHTGELTSLASSATGASVYYVKIDNQFLVNTGIADPLAAGNDSLVDTPTNGTQVDTGVGGEVVGNYATLNPLKVSGQTLKNGNLVCSGTSGNVAGTIYVSTGKYYWEFTAGSSYTMSGIESSLNSNMSYPGATSEQYALYGNAGSGQIYHNGSASSFDGFVSGDVIGVALDMNEGKLYFYKNGSAMNSGNPAATGLLGKAWTCNCRSGSGAYDGDTIFNFGQRAFAYTAPSGYKSLNTSSLPTPTIADGSTAFNGVTYTGDGNSPRDITGYSFSPDLVWYKQRDSARDHQLYDIVRGAGTDKSLATNTTYAENANDDELYGYLSAFNSDGFEVTTGSTNYNYNNNSGSTYVAWAWDAGSSNTTIAAGELNSSLYDQSRTWSGDLSASNLASPTLMFDWTYGYGTYTGTCTWTTTNAAYSNLSGRVYLANNTTVTLGITFKDSNGTTLGTFNLPWTGNGTQMQDTGFDWSSSVATVEITGNYLPVRVQIGSKTIVDTGVTVSNVPSIASTVRANPSAGFSIVGWSGQAGTNTVGHGLNAAPELIILKDRTNAGAWVVGSDYIGWGNRLELNTTAAASSASADFNSTAPTASVFTVGSNQSSGNKIAYCFAPVEGYSAMGNYTGNGSTDGPFMYTGFRPAFLLIKNSSLAGSNWIIIDTARDTFNEADHLLKSNVSDAEQITTANEVDILSNGFKPRGTDGDTNGNGNTLVYAAFAEHPFKTARAR